MPQIIAALQLASAGSDLPGGFVYPLHVNLWDYVLDSFQQAYDAGSRKLLLHRTTGSLVIQSGIDKRTKMSMFSGILYWSDPRTAKILSGTTRFLAQFRRRFPDARIIAYFGTIRGLYGPFAHNDQGRRHAWVMARRAMGSWLISSIVDICFDEAGHCLPGDPYGHVIEQTAKTIGPNRKVYVQAWPQAWSTTSKYPSIRLEHWQGTWGDSRPDYIGGTLWLEGNSVAAFPKWKNNYAEWARYRMSQGFDVAIQPRHIPQIVKQLDWKRE